MTEHEEIAKTLKVRLSELRTHLAKVDRELHKALPADCSSFHLHCGASSREKLDTFSDQFRQLARAVEQMQTDQEADEFMRTMEKRLLKLS